MQRKPKWEREARPRRELVWDLLLDGQWHTTAEISAPDVGGTEGTRRLRELSAEIEQGLRGRWFSRIVRRQAEYSTQWEYRLVRFKRKEK